MYRFSDLVALSWARAGKVSVTDMKRLHEQMDSPDLELSVGLYRDITRWPALWWNQWVEESGASGLVIMFDLDRVTITYDQK